MNRIGILILVCCYSFASVGQPSTVSIDLSHPGKPISPDLFGIFFEDLNYAADGGLYGQMIQNGSFEYSPLEQRTWNPLTAWELTARGGGKGLVDVAAGNALHENNPQFAVLEVSDVGEGVGIANRGFDGIVLMEGEAYDVSLFARHLYNGTRWARDSNSGTPGTLRVRFENKDGENLGEATLDPPDREWKKLTATITAKRSDEDARFVILSNTKGGVGLDQVSVFPRKTFRNRPNGMRADLAQTIADLKPKFVRFPGGCLAHGDGLANIYRWKDTIGPLEQRRQQRNLWGYHQSVGLGYFEYFQFCEDIGAKPLPVVAAGVCCQNAGHVSGIGQRGIPMERMPEYVQEVLDLVEWANGPAESTWGAKRAAAGHPEPFGLKYLGVGNEDHITPVFEERFKLIFDALKAKHPEITVIGSVGPFPEGEDFDAGWKIANELKVPVVDEHYYKPPEWFVSNLSRYDSYDRARSKVYVGEYAAHDVRRQTTLRSALAEAMYMTALERNGDVVQFASYAPLLARVGHTQWNPDLIYFTNTRVSPTINYYVQQMFGANQGDQYLPAQTSDFGGEFALSCVRDSASRDVVIKMVNIADQTKPLRIELKGAGGLDPTATKTVLSGDALAVNKPDSDKPLTPASSTMTVGVAFDYEAPAHSLTVIRMKPGK